MQADIEVTGVGSYCASYNGLSYINSEECLSAFKKTFNTDVQASHGTLQTVKPITRTNITTFNAKNTAVDIDACSRSLFRQYAMADGSYLGYNICGGQFLITFDLNGNSKPNRLGYDIFMFYLSKSDKIEGFEPEELTDEDLQNYREKLEASNISYKEYSYSIHGNPCNYTSTQTLNGRGCGYYAIRNKCPDGSNKGYFECLK
jgi:hypothetical protein